MRSVVHSSRRTPFPSSIITAHSRRATGATPLPPRVLVAADPAVSLAWPRAPGWLWAGALACARSRPTLVQLAGSAPARHTQPLRRFWWRTSAATTRDRLRAACTGHQAGISKVRGAEAREAPGPLSAQKRRSRGRRASSAVCSRACRAPRPLCLCVCVSYVNAPGGAPSDPAAKRLIAGTAARGGLQGVHVRTSALCGVGKRVCVGG